MAAPKKNKFWMQRSKHGRRTKVTLHDIQEAYNSYLTQKKAEQPLFISELYGKLGISATYLTNQSNNEVENELVKIKREFSQNNIELYKKGLIPIQIVARALSGKSIEKEFNEDYFEISTKKRRDQGYFKQQSEGYVYFIKSQCSTYYKIGFSTNPKRRLRDISSGVPFKIKILAIKKDIFASQLELNLHKKFKEQSCKGEWYKLKASQENEIIKIIQNS